jgi:hypothetical protein
MRKYFLNSAGVPTRRIAGKPGAGHIEIATAAERLSPEGDVYQQMFALGYVRVAETDHEVLVDAPKALTHAQAQFFKEKAREGKRITVNDHSFIEARSKTEVTASQLTEAELLEMVRSPIKPDSELTEEEREMIGRLNAVCGFDSSGVSFYEVLEGMPWDK